MFYLSRLCRILLLSLLLVSFLQRSVQDSFLEALHTVTHVQDWITGSLSYHNYHNHEANHLHVSLNKLKRIQDNKQEENKLEVVIENKVKMVKLDIKDLIVQSRQIIVNFQYSFSFQNPFIPIVVPPPGKV